MGKLFLSARRRIHIKKLPFFYLCIRKILFVAQIIPLPGTFIYAQIIIYKYTDAKKMLFRRQIIAKFHVGVNVECFFITQ
jgi:hypothetical protein